MAIKQETITLHDYGEFGENSAQANIRRRTTSKGTKERVSLEIRAEPLVHMFDDTSLGAGPAEVIRDILSQDIKGIRERIANATIDYRWYAKQRLRGMVGTKHTKSGRRRHQVSKDVPESLRRRYAGGRIGFKEPMQTLRKFNDSGRLADGLSVRQNTRAFNYAQNAQEIYWTINTPANRFTEHTQHLVKELFELVESLQNPRKIISDQRFKDAVTASLDQMIVKAEDVRDIKRKQLKLARLNALKKAFNAVRVLAKV